MRTTRSLAVLAAAALPAVLLAGCAPAAGSGEEEITLSVWSWQAASAPAWEKVFDVYEAEHPGVTVEFEGYQATEYNQVLATGLEGSDGPDVAMLRAYGGAQAAIRAEQLVPLDDEIDGLDEIDPVVLRAAQGADDGVLYGVPFAYQTMQMYYNAALFDELGLEEPTTWDEFIALQEDLQKAEVTPMALGAREDWVLPMFADIVGSARYGGAQFEERVLSGETDFTDPDYVSSLQIVQDMQQYLDPDVERDRRGRRDTAVHDRAGGPVAGWLVRPRRVPEGGARPRARRLPGAAAPRIGARRGGHPVVRRRQLRHQQGQRAPGRGARAAEVDDDHASSASSSPTR